MDKNVIVGQIKEKEAMVSVLIEKVEEEKKMAEFILTKLNERFAEDADSENIIEWTNNFKRSMATIGNYKREMEMINSQLEFFKQVAADEIL